MVKGLFLPPYSSSCSACFNSFGFEFFSNLILHHLLTLGVLGNLVSILIYFISTSGVTIFGVPPQPLIPFGVLIKALEAVFVLASLYVLKARASIPRL